MKLSGAVGLSIMAQEWIGVDLDGTLAKYDGWKNGEIGEPIPAMMARVKKWLAEGKTVKIFTARLHDDPGGMQKSRIQTWCLKNLGQALEVTNVKDHQMTELWDDRAVHVEKNTGKVVG